MRSARRGVLTSVLATWVFGVAGCSVGVGNGVVSGEVFAPACGLDGAFDLAPAFFVAEAIESKLEIRVQRGADYDFYSDGISVGISDTAALRDMLGVPIELNGERDALVTMNFYANEACPLADVDLPVNYLAQSGTVTFVSLYAPDIDDERLISASFEGVRFVDPANPAERYAVLSGSFDFLYNRGRPAQRFP